MSLLALRLTAGGTATALALGGLLWLPFAGRRTPRSPRRLWLAAPAGGVLFLAGVFWLQAPVQAIASRLLLRDISPFTLQAWPVLVAVPLALIAGLVQEGARLAATTGALRLAGRGRGAAPWAGALAGAGVGLFEAAWLLGAIPPAHFRLFGPAVLERLLAIAFHIGAGALIGLGIAARRATAAFVLAVLLHGLIDTGAALYQMGRVPSVLPLWLVGVVGVGLFAVTLGVMWRGGGDRVPGGPSGGVGGTAPC